MIRWAEMGTQHVWTVVATFAALGSAFLAALYTWLTYRLVRSQTEPNVVVYLRHDESRSTVLQIVIENIGKGLATDVSFTLSSALPARAFGLTEQNLQPVEPMTKGPLIDGILALGPGDSRKMAWGQYYALKKVLGDEPVRVVCHYRQGRRKMKSVASALDVQSFTATDAVGSEGERIVKELDRIAKATENLAGTVAMETHSRQAPETKRAEPP